MPSLSLLEMFVIIWVGACVHRLVYYTTFSRSSASFTYVCAFWKEGLMLHYQAVQWQFDMMLSTIRISQPQ